MLAASRPQGGTLQGGHCPVCSCAFSCAIHILFLQNSAGHDGAGDTFKGDEGWQAEWQNWLDGKLEAQEREREADAKKRREKEEANRRQRHKQKQQQQQRQQQ